MEGGMGFVGGTSGLNRQRNFRSESCVRRGRDGFSKCRSRRVITRMAAAEESESKYQREEAELLNTLKAVIDPDLGKDIVTLGFVQEIQFAEDGDKLKVSFNVELTTPACPIKDQFRTDCKDLAESLPFISSADVNMTAVDVSTTVNGALKGVRSVIAVASCKGGVGKSTTAVNLAYALSKAGARVGLMDADIYGPSLPTMVVPETDMVEFEEGLIKPMQYKGVKLMSFGYVNSDSAIMRGPMIANMLSQLLTTTNWGDLDYLIIDMPPGTGDVQLTLSQNLNITAAVIVTTPQKLSFVDVVKGIDMFTKVNVPSIAVVENMSYFEAPDTKTKHYIFGSGYTHRLKNQFGIQNSFGIPIETDLAEKCDAGVPFVVSEPNSETSKIYDEIAKSVVVEVAKIQHGALPLPKVTLDKESGLIVVDVEGSPKQEVVPAELRRKCRCALCIDEMTGVKILKDEDVPESISPRAIRPVGNYATQIDWSDGHISLYPFSKFVDAWVEGPRREERKVEQVEEPELATA
mmetsp:Transcript_25677/g.101250  ORF Transcript_25677/g.101250 Transcript_25677/m.101250 type:complete len:520 (-) Transcript_25677:110-1669(-)